MLPAFYVDDVIRRAITEDINYIDLATDLLIPTDSISCADFVSKDTGVIAGIDIALRVFELVDPSIQIT